MAAAGFNFSLLIRWLAILLQAIFQPILPKPQMLKTI
jgi:hypothetical protein